VAESEDSSKFIAVTRTRRPLGEAASRQKEKKGAAMKWMKLAVAALAAFSFGNAYAFHDGGVAECDGCHVMHNAGPSQGGKKSTFNGNSAILGTNQGGSASAVAPWTNVTNAYLLQGSDQSSTCLMCHAGPKTPFEDFIIADLVKSAQTDVPSNRSPGGDFGWLKIPTLTATASYGALVTAKQERRGHNIVATDFNLAKDPNFVIAPGGTYTGGPGKAAFACSSCHDPHGRYRIASDAPVVFQSPLAQPGPNGTVTKGTIKPIQASGSYVGAVPTADYAVGAYRLLAGAGYAPISNPSFPFANPPPVAVAPKSYNQGEAAQEVRVAYGNGMSEWCQNCHTNIHLDAYMTGQAGLRHPAGNGAKLPSTEANIYNQYKSSGDLSATAAYTSLVPFESGSNSLAALGGVATNAGDRTADATGLFVASTSSNVMCLSCHRAHASAFDSMLRWNMDATFVTVDGEYPGADAATTEGKYGELHAGRTQAQIKAGYYDRDSSAFGKGFQRSLCNKCHAKD